MKRRLLLSVFLVVLLLVAATPAFAGYTWCMTDPLIQLKSGGVLHVLVEVPEEHANTPLTIDVTAPAGARVVGNTHNIIVVMHEGADNQVTVAEAAGFPVRLSVRFKGRYLQPGVVTLPDGRGGATWTW